MSFFETLKDVLLRFISIDKNIETLEKGLDEVSQTDVALNEKLQKLTERVVTLESASATKSNLQELSERVSKLETARDDDLARIEAAIAQLSAQRSQLEADVERHITRLQRETPQLPPTTDN